MAFQSAVYIYKVFFNQDASNGCFRINVIPQSLFKISSILPGFDSHLNITMNSHIKIKAAKIVTVSQHKV